MKRPVYWTVSFVSAGIKGEFLGVYCLLLGRFVKMFRSCAKTWWWCCVSFYQNQMQNVTMKCYNVTNAKCVSRLCNWIMDWYFWNTLDWVFFRFHWIFRNKFLVKYTFTFYFTIFVYYCLPSAYIKNYNNKKLLSIGVWYFLHKCLFPPRDEFQRMQHIVSFPFCGLDFLINYIMRQALTKPGKCANPIVLHSEWFGEEMKWKKREENYHHRKPKLLAARLPELCLKGLTVLRSFRVIVM